MKSFTKFASLLVAVAALLVFASAASADTFSYSITGGYTASGTITTGAESGGSYLITGITGTQGGKTITSLLPVGGFADNDNLLFASGPLLDLPGFSFVAGGVDYNVYYGGGDFGGSPTAYYETTVSGDLGSQVNFSVMNTPEPSTFALFGLGLLGLAILGRSKRNAVSVVA